MAFLRMSSWDIKNSSHYDELYIAIFIHMCCCCCCFFVSKQKQISNYGVCAFAVRMVGHYIVNRRHSIHFAAVYIFFVFLIYIFKILDVMKKKQQLNWVKDNRLMMKLIECIAFYAVSIRLPTEGNWFEYTICLFGARIWNQQRGGDLAHK